MALRLRLTGNAVKRKLRHCFCAPAVFPAQWRTEGWNPVGSHGRVGLMSAVGPDVRGAGGIAGAVTALSGGRGRDLFAKDGRAKAVSRCACNRSPRHRGFTGDIQPGLDAKRSRKNSSRICKPASGVNRFLRQCSVLQATFIRVFFFASVDDGRFVDRIPHRPVEQSVFFKVD